MKVFYLYKSTIIDLLLVNNSSNYMNIFLSKLIFKDKIINNTTNLCNFIPQEYTVLLITTNKTLTCN